MSNNNGGRKPANDSWPGLSRRGFLAASGAGAAASLLLPSGHVRAATTGETLKIGVMGPFTGPASRTGDSFKKGFAMALEDAAKHGLTPVKIEGQPHDVELVYIDSQSDPEKAVLAETDAINRQGVKFLVGGWHSSVAMAVMDVEAPYKLVHIGHMGEAQTIDEKINKDPQKYAGWFKGWPAPPIFAGLYGPPLKYFLEQDLWQPANKKAAVLVEDTDYGRGWGDALHDSLQQAGFDVLPYDVTALDETEFTPLITKYKAQRVSLVAMTSTGSVSASNFVKQFRSQNLKALLLGHGLTWFSEWYKLTGDASDYTVTADSPRVIAPWQQAWVDRYKAKYDEDPSIAACGHMYDYLLMGLTILNKAGTLDFDKLAQTTVDTPYKGVWQYYQFAREKGPHAMAPHEIMTGDFMKGFFFPMVQLMNGNAPVIWPLEYAKQKFESPPWLSS